MKTLLRTIADIVTRKPIASLTVLAVITIGLASGMSLLQPQAGSDVFLPANNEVADAAATL